MPYWPGGDYAPTVTDEKDRDASLAGSLGGLSKEEWGSSIERELDSERGLNGHTEDDRGRAKGGASAAAKSKQAPKIKGKIIISTTTISVFPLCSLCALVFSREVEFFFCLTCLNYFFRTLSHSHTHSLSLSHSLTLSLPLPHSLAPTPSLPHSHSHSRTHTTIPTHTYASPHTHSATEGQGKG